MDDSEKQRIEDARKKRKEVRKAKKELAIRRKEDEFIDCIWKIRRDAGYPFKPGSNAR
jgi:hypothetical protein